MGICSFADKATEVFFLTGRISQGAGWSALSKVAARKLDMIDYATSIDDLMSPPGNRLERLEGDFDGHWSIRINRQWRIVFRWSAAGAEEVQIIDYH